MQIYFNTLILLVYIYRLQSKDMDDERRHFMCIHIDGPLLERL